MSGIAYNLYSISIESWTRNCKYIGRFYLCPSPFDAHLQEIKVLLYKLFLSCCKDDMSFLTHLHSIFKEVLSSLKNKIIVAKVIELFPCYCKSPILILGWRRICYMFVYKTDGNFEHARNIILHPKNNWNNNDLVQNWIPFVIIFLNRGHIYGMDNLIQIIENCFCINQYW